MFAIRISINNPQGKLKSLEEFLLLDNSENADVWDQYGSMILEHVASGIISDAKRESFDVESQTYSLIFYSNTEEHAQKFLDDYNSQSYYINGMENLKKKGWTTVETVEPADRFAAMGANKISIDWHQFSYKVTNS